MFDKDKTIERHLFPHVGQRIIKTTVAVFLCLIVCWIRSLFGQDITPEAAITAVICMQPYGKDTKKFALNRISGTVIGSVWGILFLLMLAAFPVLGTNKIVLYMLMAGGILISLYSAVLVRQPGTADLAAIVFICIVIAFPNIDRPLVQALNRFLDVLTGTGIAILVNIFRLPRDKNTNTVFFIRTKDLVPDRFSQVAAAVMFKLNYLYNDGAKICLMAEHAPAYFVSQMNMVKVNMPLIVMDGAAIYDIDENVYLYKKTIPEEVSSVICARLDELGVSYFVYTIHNNKTCIFHRGVMTDMERTLYDKMRKSPYRRYLDGEICNPEEIVYLKILNKKEKLMEIFEDLYNNRYFTLLEIKPVIRPDNEEPELDALYLYSCESTMENAQAYLMDEMRKDNPDLVMKEISLRIPYRSERDAMHLLHAVEKDYAPVKWFKID